MKKILLIAALVATNLYAQPVIIDHGTAVTTSEAAPVARFSGDGKPPKVQIDVPTAPVYMQVEMSVGPLLSSGNFQPFAANLISNLWDGWKPSGAPTMNPAKYAPLGYRLDPGYVMAPANGSGTKMWLGQENPSGLSAGEAGNTLWSSVHVWSERMFYPTGLVCQFISSGNNLFGKTDTFLSPNIVYSITSKGAIWGSGGRRVNDTEIQGGSWSSVKANEFAFVGSASKTLLTPNQAQADANRAWMLGFSDFEIVSIWTLYGENGEVLARFAKKVQTKGEPMPGSLTLTRLGNGRVQVGVNTEMNRTSWLESTVKVNPASWQTIGLANAGDSFIFDDPIMRFFRLRSTP